MDAKEQSAAQAMFVYRSVRHKYNPDTSQRKPYVTVTPQSLWADATPEVREAWLAVVECSREREAAAREAAEVARNDAVMLRASLDYLTAQREQLVAAFEEPAYPVYSLLTDEVDGCIANGHA